MEKKQHIPKYAAGGEMDRLARPTRSYYQRRPPGRLFLLLILVLLLVHIAKQHGFTIPNAIPKAAPNTAAYADNFEFADITSDYDPQTGDITLSSSIRALSGLYYNVKIILEYSADGHVIYTDTQILRFLSWYEETAFSFDFDLKKQCALHNVPGNAQFSCKISALGYSLI